MIDKGLPEAPLPADGQPQGVDRRSAAALALPGLSAIALDHPAEEVPPLPLGLWVPDLG